MTQLGCLREFFNEIWNIYETKYRTLPFYCPIIIIFCFINSNIFLALMVLDEIWAKKMELHPHFYSEQLCRKSQVNLYQMLPAVATDHHNGIASVSCPLKVDSLSIKAVNVKPHRKKVANRCVISCNFMRRMQMSAQDQNVSDFNTFSFLLFSAMFCRFSLF